MAGTLGGGEAVKIERFSIVFDHERNIGRRQTPVIADQYVEPIVALQLIGHIQWHRRLAGD